MALSGNSVPERNGVWSSEAPRGEARRKLWVPAEHEKWLRSLEVPGLQLSDIQAYRDYRGDLLVDPSGSAQILLVRSRDWNTAPSRILMAVENAGAARVLVVPSLGDTVAKGPETGLWDVIDPRGPAEAAVQRLSHTLGEVEREASRRESLTDAEYWRRYVDELTQIGVALSTERDLQKLLSLIVLTARRLICADAGSLYLVVDDPNAEAGPVVEVTRRKVRFEVAQNDSVDLPFRSAVLDVSQKTIYGYVAITQETLNLADVYNLPPGVEFSWGGRPLDASAGYRTKSMLTVPLVDWNRQTVGVLQLINRKENNQVRLAGAEAGSRVLPFGERDVRLAASVASQASIAIQNALLVTAERRRLEQMLSAGERRFQSLIEGSTQGMAIYRDQKPLFANGAYARILGFGGVEEYLAGFQFAERFPPEEARRMQDLQAAPEGEAEPPRSYEVRATGRAGRPMWLSAIARCITWQGGPAVQVTVTDITARKAAELNLRASEERFRNLVEGSIQGYVIHRGNKMLFANAAMARIFGFGSPADLVALRGWSDVIAPEDRERVTQLNEARLQGGTAPARYEFSGSHFNGTHLHVEVAERVVDWDGEPALQGTLNDITERKRTEAIRRELEHQIQHRQKLESLGVLAGGLAHDFNNILTGILGNAELAAGELGDTALVKKHLDVITAASERASHLTRQMLAYAGKGKVRIEPIDLNQVVEALQSLLAAAVPKHVRLRTELDRKLPRIEGDVAQIEQVVMNLITNAAEAMGQAEGDVTISTEVTELTAGIVSKMRLKRPLATGRYACIQVRDTGAGMSEEVQARIFEPFFTTKLAGRGLGMSAVLGIVRGHRGAVDIHTTPGAGSTFRVYLPLGSDQAPAAAEPAVDAAAPLRPRTGRILVVDDEPMVRDVLAGMLKRLGYEVDLAANGLEGLTLLDREPGAVRAVFLDMNMPGLSPEETLRRMRDRLPDLRVVLCSGYGGEEAMRRMGNLSPGEFLQKPFTRSRLVKALSGALGE